MKQVSVKKFIELNKDRKRRGKARAPTSDSDRPSGITSSLSCFPSRG